MTLLSDNQIRAFCEQPIGEVTFAVRKGGAMVEMRKPIFAPKNASFGAMEQMSYMEQEGHRICRKYGGRNTITIDSLEQDVDFKPMISPFTAGQVREAERNGTFEESAIYMAGGKSALIDHLGEEVTNIRHDPLLGLQIREKIISYGTSSYGYDVSLAPEFKIFTNINSTVLNPKKFDERSFVDVTGDVCIIPPNSFALARSREYIVMPKDVSGIVLGKSTYARCGIVCIATPLEAGWEGHITLEYANTTPLPAMLFANEGGAQVMFFQGDELPDVSYRDRKGKYMHQRGITLPKV